MFASLNAEQNEQALLALRDYMVMILCQEPELYVHFYRNPPTVTTYIAIICRDVWAEKFPSDEELSISLEEMEKLILDVKSLTSDKCNRKFKVVNKTWEHFAAMQRAKKSRKSRKLHKIRNA